MVFASIFICFSLFCLFNLNKRTSIKNLEDKTDNTILIITGLLIALAGLSYFVWR